MSMAGMTLNYWIYYDLLVHLITFFDGSILYMTNFLRPSAPQFLANHVPTHVEKIPREICPLGSSTSWPAGKAVRSKRFDQPSVAQLITWCGHGRSRGNMRQDQVMSLLATSASCTWPGTGCVLAAKGWNYMELLMPANGSYIFLWQSSLESVLSYEQSSGESGNFSGRSPTSCGRADQAMGNAGSAGWSNASNWVFHCGCLLVFWKGQRVKSD